jgi:hypothetical protein
MSRCSCNRRKETRRVEGTGVAISGRKLGLQDAAACKEAVVVEDIQQPASVSAHSSSQPSVPQGFAAWLLLHACASAYDIWLH